MRRDGHTKAGFCNSLPWGLVIDWFDLTGLHKLKAGRLVKIELATRGTIDHYPGFRVTILNKHEGVVDEKYFLFDDYLDRSPEARTDGRDNYPTNGKGRCYEVIGYCGWDWYIATPKSAVLFCTAVEGYIDLFR